MYIDESKPSALAMRLSAYDYVVVDTCSLMEDSFPIFADMLLRSKEYWKEGLEIIVLSQCVEELKRHSKDRSKDAVAKRIAAKRARKILKHAKRHKLIVLLKRKEETFADNQIYNFVNSHRLSSKVAVITQDKTLAGDLRGQNRLSSQNGERVDVYRLNSVGELELNRVDHQGYKKVDKVAPKQPAIYKGHSIENILSFDKRLYSNLTNPNYPQRKKESDVAHQISTLKGLGEKVNELKLHYSIKELEDILKGLKETPIPPRVKKEPTEKVVPHKPIGKDEPYISAHNLFDAFRQYCDSNHIIIRDDSVSYFKPVHGPVDITTSKFEEFINSLGKLPEEKTPINFFGRDLEVNYYKKQVNIYLVLDPSKLTKKEKPVIAKEPIKVIQKVEETPQKEDKKEETEPKKPGKSNRKIVQATTRTVVPKGATLIVGVPDNEKAAKAIERKVSRLAESEAKEPKKVKAKEAKPKSDKAKEAFDNDKKLQANLSNPNFPKAKAIEALTTQIDLLHSLKPNERTGLKFGLRELKSKLNELKNS